MTSKQLLTTWQGDNSYKNASTLPQHATVQITTDTYEEVSPRHVVHTGPRNDEEAAYDIIADEAVEDLL
jgi:hypothetical protein